MFSLGNQDYQYQPFLPTTLEELGGLDEGGLRFQEVTTRSPRLCHVRHTLLPVFLVSGLGVQDIRPLTHQLAHPAFVANLPSASQYSIEEYAELLMQVNLNSTAAGIAWSRAWGCKTSNHCPTLPSLSPHFLRLHNFIKYAELLLQVNLHVLPLVLLLLNCRVQTLITYPPAGL